MRGQSAEIRFFTLGAPEDGGKTSDTQPAELERTVYQPAADGYLSDAVPWRHSGPRRPREARTNLALPREWWWTHICYWDVGISTQFSLLPLLLLLYTHTHPDGYAERLITQLSGHECN